MLTEDELNGHDPGDLAPRSLARVLCNLPDESFAREFKEALIVPGKARCESLYSLARCAEIISAASDQRLAPNAIGDLCDLPTAQTLLGQHGHYACTQDLRRWVTEGRLTGYRVGPSHQVLRHEVSAWGRQLTRDPSLGIAPNVKHDATVKDDMDGLPQQDIETDDELRAALADIGARVIGPTGSNSRDSGNAGERGGSLDSTNI